MAVKPRLQSAYPELTQESNRKGHAQLVMPGLFRASRSGSPEHEGARMAGKS